MAVYTSAAIVYNRAGLSATEIDLTANTQIIVDAEAELELITGRKFTDAISITEYFDGPRRDIFDNKITRIVLHNYPILTITSFLLLNPDGTTNTTLDTLSAGEVASDDYYMQQQEDPLSQTQISNGTIDLRSLDVPVGKQTVKVVYTYGYSAVPANIVTLATCMSGIRAWVQFLGGKFNNINSYSIPQQSVNKGDLFAKGKQIIQDLQAEADLILDRVGRKSRTLAFATGGS